MLNFWVIKLDGIIVVADSQLQGEVMWGPTTNHEEAHQAKTALRNGKTPYNRRGGTLERRQLVTE